MHGMILLMQATHLHQAFHLTMQARFTNLKVDDKTLRADAYIWIPSDPDFNLIVECDGYQFHSDQAAFGRDPEAGPCICRCRLSCLTFFRS